MPDEKERFEVLMEHMDRKFDVILEGHQVLRRDIGEVREEARELNRETELKLNLVAKNLQEQIGKIDQKLDTIGEKVEEHEQIIRT
ncbi:MAG: hypothetical protein V1789_04850 [PVC group bacterium]